MQHANHGLALSRGYVKALVASAEQYISRMNDSKDSLIHWSLSMHMSPQAKSSPRRSVFNNGYHSMLVVMLPLLLLLLLHLPLS